MRISFDISDDGELRDAVKELIRGQVVRVIRETIGAELQNIVKRKTAEFDRAVESRKVDIDKRIRDAILEAIHAELVPRTGSRLVERLAREEVAKAAASYLPPRIA